MISQATTSLLLLLSSTVQAVAPIDTPLPVIKPQFNSPAQAWIDLFNALPTVPSKVETLVADYSIGTCGAGSSENYITYNILYDDCPEPWEFCIWKDSEVAIEEAAEMLGKLPASYRQYIRDLTVDNGNFGFWNASSIVIGKIYWRFYTIVHEATHAVDLLDIETLAPLQNGTYSHSKEWQDAYHSDKSAPTLGANVNWEESFAEMGPRAFYDWYVEGGLGNFQPNWNEFGNQLAAFKSLVEPLAQLGGTCSFRLATGATQQRRRSTSGYVSKSGIPIIDVPENLPTIVFSE